MQKYRIIEGIYKNEYGKEERRAYYIQKRKSFLGITYWGYHTHEECGYADCHNVKTEFKTYEDAMKFIKENLCGKTFKEGWSYNVMREVNCEN